jgi:hypothetical protein
MPISLSSLLHLEAAAFVYAMAFVVVSGLLTFRINTKGLFLDKSGSGRVRPERVQLLVATIALAFKYTADLSGTTGSTFPQVDHGWLYLLGGSSSVYVTRKLYERFGGREGNNN